MPYEIDLNNLDKLPMMVEECEANLGTIDILVNNAGVNIPQKAEEVTVEAWDKIININLRAQFFCSQAVGQTHD